MENDVLIEGGFAHVAAGDWLMGREQPTAFADAATARGLKGFVVPDRAWVRHVALTGAGHCAAAEAPFLTRLDALPDTPLKLVSKKLLVAPFAARTGARSLKLIPFSFSRATAVTEFRLGWAVAATRSRVARVALAEGATLSVRPEAVVAWIGADPSGFCPRLSVFDLILPRMPRALSYTFHGPATVWFEGSQRPAERQGRSWRRIG